METQRQNGTLTVTGLRELSAANARLFRNTLCAALSPDLQLIEIDMSETEIVDGCGMGALMSFYKAASEYRNGKAMAIRLINPAPSVQQMIELTRMHHVFEVISSPEGMPAAARNVA